jgi:hypothetical protein
MCNCGKKFNHASSLSRHKKDCSEVKLNEKLDILLKKIDNYEKLNKELLTYVKENKPITYNISVKNYIQKKFSDAPELLEMTEYAKLTFDDEDFIGTITYKYNNNCLDSYLGDFIVQYYKKEDPSQQSLWNSDISRLTYIIKELMANNKSIWNHDFKGVKTKNYIINPLLKYIKKTINDYWVTHIDNMKSLEMNEIIKLQMTLQSLYKIKKEIETGNLANSIIKYIAPYFYMDRKNQEDNIYVEHFIDSD